MQIIIYQLHSIKTQYIIKKISLSKLEIKKKCTPESSLPLTSTLLMKSNINFTYGNPYSYGTPPLSLSLCTCKAREVGGKCLMPDRSSINICLSDEDKSSEPAAIQVIVQAKLTVIDCIDAISKQAKLSQVVKNRSIPVCV